jgi:hypothetical protein
MMNHIQQLRFLPWDYTIIKLGCMSKPIGSIKQLLLNWQLNLGIITILPLLFIIWADINKLYSW